MDEAYFIKKLEKLGSTIKVLRMEKGMSQESFAKLAEIDRSHLQKIESGRNFSMVLLLKICMVLEITEDELFLFANKAHSKVFIRNANKILTNGEALTNDEVAAYANNGKSLRAETKIRAHSKTKCLYGGDKCVIINKIRRINKVCA